MVKPMRSTVRKTMVGIIGLLATAIACQVKSRQVDNGTLTAGVALGTAFGITNRYQRCGRPSFAHKPDPQQAGWEECWLRRDDNADSRLPYFIRINRCFAKDAGYIDMYSATAMPLGETFESGYVESITCASLTPTEYPQLVVRQTIGHGTGHIEQEYCLLLLKENALVEAWRGTAYSRSTLEATESTISVPVLLQSHGTHTYLVETSVTVFRPLDAQDVPDYEASQILVSARMFRWNATSETFEPLGDCMPLEKNLAMNGQLGLPGHSDSANSPKP